MIKVLVFTTVYPNDKQQNLGVFVRERIGHVAHLCNLKVVAPVPWFPFAGLIKEKYRKRPSYFEEQGNIEVYHPRFFLIPGFCKWLDGLFLFLSSYLAIKRLRREFDFDIIDSHFAYPDGFAAILLGKSFKVPVTITLRGTINRFIHFRARGPMLKWALRNADRVFSVSGYLVELARKNIPDIDSAKFKVIPNGVDTAKFKIIDKAESRKKLDLPQTSRILISVGGLVDRKGHHRVLEILPGLIKKIPDLLYIIVGGSTVEGNNREQLVKIIEQEGMTDHVLLTGEVPHSEVNRYLSAADIFVLPTQFEGWPNVFFEAMSCGLPVVSTDVCGNKEIIGQGTNGLLVPFADKAALLAALEKAFETEWDRASIITYAHSRPWEVVAHEVFEQFNSLMHTDNP